MRIEDAAFLERPEYKRPGRRSVAYSDVRMSIPRTVALDYGALYPAELLERYREGERDFARINVLREEIEFIASVRARDLDPPPYPDERYNTLWSDFRSIGDREFEWDSYGHFIPTEFDDVLPDRDLKDADLGEANFDGSYLYPVDLSNANLHRCSFRRALIFGAKLRGADLSYADLRDAVVVGDLSGANLYMARLERCIIGGTAVGCNLQRAKLGRANLSGLDLRGASLAKAHFGATSLSGADLRDISWDDVELTSVDVTSALLQHRQIEPFLHSLRIRVK